MLKYYIWLLSVMGAANPRTMRIISHFGGIKETYDALTSRDAKFEAALKPWEVKSLKKSSLEKAEELIEWCKKRSYNIVTFDDEDYPEQLKHIYNPPLVLFIEGSLAAINSEIRINVIGTRKPSDYSCMVASHICAELAKTGIVIISGMAVGLDKCSMSAALENRGIVAGVLACGIDVEYPKGSKAFRSSVVESGGVCISELMPRDETRPAYFQYRNRIMSGLSSGTLIVEAGERSGCHITALHAISQNRDLFCIPPHDILDPRYSGVLRYLRDGAIPVFSHIDIINEYLSDVCERFDEVSNTQKSTTVLKTEKSPKSASPKNIEKSDIPPAKSAQPSQPIFKSKAPVPQPAPKADYSQLPEEQTRIIAALQKKKLTFDEIVKKKLCDAAQVYEILLDMELDGLIEKIAGDRYTIM
ncbi:MAG: DNA-protecting protein DprA [Oscillospiraceae bacterium]|nr:DNA-protecting protein DprA [Oscillospiraceae bacterium]